MILAGQVGLAGHLKIGNHVTVAAKSGVMHDIPDGEKWLGIPAQPDRQTKRQLIAIQHLPELLRRVAALEKKTWPEIGMNNKRQNGVRVAAIAEKNLPSFLTKIELDNSCGKSRLVSLPDDGSQNLMFDNSQISLSAHRKNQSETINYQLWSFYSGC